MDVDIHVCFADARHTFPIIVILINEVFDFAPFYLLVVTTK